MCEFQQKNCSRTSSVSQYSKMIYVSIFGKVLLFRKVFTFRTVVCNHFSHIWLVNLHILTLPKTNTCMQLDKINNKQPFTNTAHCYWIVGQVSYYLLMRTTQNEVCVLYILMKILFFRPILYLNNDSWNPTSKSNMHIS